MAESGSSSRGIGFFGLLTIVFIVLKLTGYIGWSWWWVTAPLWGPALAFAWGAAVFLFIAALVQSRRNRSGGVRSRR